jgi:IS1 family transposase/transposase-like protein
MKPSFRPIPSWKTNHKRKLPELGVFAVIAIVCQHENRRQFAKTKAGTPRFRCKTCGKTWTEATSQFDGMRIGMDRACQIVELLCEGMSVRAVSRITDTHKQTILDLLVLVGEKCAAMEAEQIKDIQVDDVQVDEIWQYVYCKRATAERMKIVGGCGDSWCFTAIERTTKLMICWHMGRRTLNDTEQFTHKLSKATIGHFQLSSDGFAAYPLAVRWHLGGRVDHGRVIKQFAEAGKDDRRKYSPSRIIGCKKDGVLGMPWRDRICTSHAERMNGSIRHFTKRMARLTCAFSKRWDNHRAALGLFFAHYNWVRKHRSLGNKTPAMASGLTNHVWTIRELLNRALA